MALDRTLELPHNVGGTAPHAFTRATEAGRLALRATLVAMVMKQASKPRQGAQKKQAEPAPSQQDP